jgi:Zn-dependent peptidase ImmA (M78 family)
MSLHRNRGEKRARELRAELGLGPDVPVACLLELVEDDLGIPVVVMSLPQDLAGWCWREDAVTVLWVNGEHAVVRQRFTLAHELGHVRCGHDATLVDTVDTLRAPKGTREVEANAFAAGLLAPKDGVAAMVGGEPTLEDVVRIADHFGISTIAALYRLGTLGLTRRQETLERELDDGLAVDVRDRLDLAVFDDALARVAGHHLSPALRGSMLAAILDGTVAVPTELAPVWERLGL